MTNFFKANDLKIEMQWNNKSNKWEFKVENKYINKDKDKRSNKKKEQLKKININS